MTFAKTFSPTTILVQNGGKGVQAMKQIALLIT